MIQYCACIHSWSIRITREGNQYKCWTAWTSKYIKTFFKVFFNTASWTLHKHTAVLIFCFSKTYGLIYCLRQVFLKSVIPQYNFRQYNYVLMVYNYSSFIIHTSYGKYIVFLYYKTANTRKCNNQHIHTHTINDYWLNINLTWINKNIK